MSSRTKFEQSQNRADANFDSRANLRTQNGKKNLSELRTEPTLLHYTPEEEDSKKTQIDQISHFTTTSPFHRYQPQFVQLNI